MATQTEFKFRSIKKNIISNDDISSAGTMITPSITKGKYLSEDHLSYFKRLLDQLEVVDEDEKEILAGSFFRELKNDDKFKDLASNRIVSKIIHNVLPIATNVDFISFVEELSNDLRVICTDPVGSSVLQQSMIYSLKRYQIPVFHSNDDLEESNMETINKEKNRLVSFIIKSSKFILNNLEEFMLDPRATYVVRTVLEITSGSPIAKKKTNRKPPNKHKDMVVDEGWVIPLEVKEIFPFFVDRVITKSIENMSDIATSNCGSAVLQAIITMSCEKNNLMKKSKELTKVVSKGIRTIHLDGVGEENDHKLHPIFSYNPTVRLLEVLIACCTAKQQMKLYGYFFEDNFEGLIQHPSGNFSVQKLIKEWKNSETFGEIFIAINEKILSVAFKDQKFGCILALVETCARLQLHQKICVQNVMKVLGCHEPSNHSLFLQLLIRMIDIGHYRDFEDNLPLFNLQGSLIAQEFFKFKSVSIIVNSILAMNTETLEEISCDPKGSHVIDAFLQGPTTGEKNKEKLIAKFRGKLSTLAMSPFASYSLEAMFKFASLKTKIWMCEELSANDKEIRSSKSGGFIYNNFHIKLFKLKDRSVWETALKKQDNKRKLLDDMLQSTDVVSKKLKKEKVEVKPER